MKILFVGPVLSFVLPPSSEPEMGELGSLRANEKSLLMEKLTGRSFSHQEVVVAVA